MGLKTTINKNKHKALTIKFHQSYHTNIKNTISFYINKTDKICPFSPSANQFTMMSYLLIWFKLTIYDNPSIIYK